MIDRLSIGTAQFGLNYGISNTAGVVPLADCERILDLAQERGVKKIDTAFAYGESESNLGLIGVKGFQVTSKLPAFDPATRDIEKWAVECVSRSLERLQIDRLHGLLLHKPKDLLRDEGSHIYDSLRLLKEKSLIEKIGISIYDSRELEKLSHFPMDIVQFPMNPLDLRVYNSKFYPKLVEQNVELQIRSIFLQGLLLMERNSRNPYFHKWDSTWSAWHSFLEEKQVSPLEACLGFVAQYDDVSNWIVGVNSLQQFSEILHALDNLQTLNCEDFAVTDEELLNPVNWLGKLQ